jgi:hypothetical protein
VYMNGFQNASATIFKSGGWPADLTSALLSPVIKAFNRLNGHTRRLHVSLEPLESFESLPEEWSFEMAELHEYFPHRSRKFMQWRAQNVPAVLKDDVINLWCLKDGEKIGCFTLYRDRQRNVLKLIDHLCTKPKQNMIECLKALRKYAILKKYDGITTNVASDIYQQSLKKAGYHMLKPVRATIFFLQEELIPNGEIPENFWLQLPIDRDCFDF